MMPSFRSWVERFFLLVIVVRPSLDVTTGWRMALGPLSLNPAGLVSLVLIVLGGIWFVLLEQEEKRMVLHPLPVRFFLGWLILLAPWAFMPLIVEGASFSSSLREWIRLFSYLPLFVILLAVSRRRGANPILTALGLSLLGPALTALYQILFHQGMLVQGAHRINGTFVHPNPFSFYLVLMAGLAYWHVRWSSHRFVWGCVLLLVLGLLVSTFSFTGAGMLGVFIVVLALGENKTLRYSIACVLFVFIILFIVTPTGRQRIHGISQWDNLDEIERTGRETSSLVWRLLNWRFLYRTWKQSPWVGYGLASSPYVNPNKENHGTGPGHKPHNDYVRFLIDTGSIGFPISILWMIGIGVLLMRHYRQAHAPPQRHFIWIAFALYGSWLAGSANDNLMIATAYQYCLWAILAVAFGFQKEEPEIEKP